MNVYPERCFDTGITEQHAVTFAAGLAASGMRPVVHLYSTFAQRAYDQIIHDVALQKLPVVFAIDRAGLVGEDGATHHGAFDLSYLNLVPNLEVLAPMDAAELRGMLNYALQQQGPVAIRYPRGGEPAGETLRHEIVFPSFRLLKPGKRAVVVSLGIMGRYVEEALSGNDVAHIDLRFLKPWNDALLKAALASYEVIFTIEDGSMRGGLRDTMANWLSKHLPGKKLVGIGLPDEFVGHGTPEELYESQGLSPSAIREMIDQTLATR
jgi:1-deoxy-D-xylulose-5-phosphate synthase